MQSLLFLLFLVTLLLALFNRERPSLIVYGLAMVLSVVWFLHHATSPLQIQL